jgi:hypothetical protein
MQESSKNLDKPGRITGVRVRDHPNSLKEEIQSFLLSKSSGNILAEILLKI